MKFNPGIAMKLMQFKGKFEQNHPKASSFIQQVIMTGMPEGTVIEMTVTKPGESPVTTNMKVTQDDVDMVEELKNV